MKDVRPYAECPTDSGLEDAVRYAAGTLERERIDGFEIHLLGCERCQGAVRESAELSGALQERFLRQSLPRWVVPTAAAAALALFFLRPGLGGVESLGALREAPAFSGAPARSGSSGSTVVDRGMAAYSAGDWSTAARLLAQAREEEASEGSIFFLGIARLMDGDPAGAADVLDRAAALDGPYSPEAWFYSAKAWLAQGDAEAALQRLNKIPSDAPRIGTWAKALADSVRRR